MAVTTVALPPALNANPCAAVAVNVHVPEIDPEVTVHVARLASPVSDSVTEVSVDANPDPVTVTVTPVGPDDGLSVRLVTVPVNVAVAVSVAPPLFPVAVTTVALPPALNANPVPEFATNVHVPVIDPELTVHVARLVSPGSDSVTEVSVDANPDPVTVTVTPVGPDDGPSVRLVTVPVNVIAVVSLAVFPFAVTTVALPPLLNANPVPALATNVHVPVIDPELTVHVAKLASPGSESITEVSVDANPDPVTVTVTPLGPDDGLSVRPPPVNGAVAVSPAWFPVAVTTVALPPALNANPCAAVAVNVHVPVIDPELTVHVARLASPGSDSVTEVSVDANPDPVTATVTPAKPDEGLSIRLVTVPVNVAVAMSVAPPLFPAAVTTVALPPLLKANPVPEFATNVHVPVIDPELTVQVFRLASPGSDSFTEVSVDANPDPVTVTVTPVGPDEGLRVKLVTVPVNVAVAVSVAPPWFPVAITTVPLPPPLNANPVPELATNGHVPVIDPALAVHVARLASPGSDNVTEVSVEANPEPVTVTVTPVGPDEGLSVTLVTVPVNVAVAVSLAEFPVAVTTVALPPPLNANPCPVVAVNVHVPVIDPALTVHDGTRLASPGSDSVTEVSVDANPDPVTVTVTPVGPDVGLSVRVASVPKNVTVATSEAPPLFPFAVTMVALPGGLLNANPCPVVAVNVHVPVIDPELTVHDAFRVGSPGSDSATEVSVDANPEPVTVTVTPVGPDDGLSVRPFPVNVAVAVMLDGVVPVAVTTVALPPALNANPCAAVAVNVHVPVIVPEVTEHVARVASPGFDSVTEVSGANPEPEAVTVTPLSPDEGLSVRLAIVPVNVAVAV